MGVNCHKCLCCFIQDTLKLKLSRLGAHNHEQASASKMTKLRDRTVLLTSCSSALGYAFAVQIAEKGANLVLWDSDLRLAQRIASEITRLYSVDATAIQVDMREREQVYAAARRVTTNGFRVSVVVHASDSIGEQSGQLLANKDVKEVTEQLQLHTLSSLWLVKALLPDILGAKQGGHFVFLSSSATLMGATSGLVDYAASKYALVGLTRSLQHELARLESDADISAAQHIQLTTVLAPLEDSKRPGASGGESRANTKATKVERGWMKADLIAMKTLRAVKRGKRELVLPAELSFVHALCGLLPQAWGDKLLEAMKYAPAQRVHA